MLKVVLLKRLLGLLLRIEPLEELRADIDLSIFLKGFRSSIFGCWLNKFLFVLVFVLAKGLAVVVGLAKRLGIEDVGFENRFTEELVVLLKRLVLLLLLLVVLLGLGLVVLDFAPPKIWVLLIMLSKPLEVSFTLLVPPLTFNAGPELSFKLPSLATSSVLISLSRLFPNKFTFLE